MNKALLLLMKSTLETNNKKIVARLSHKKWGTVLDAKRDNGGKGIAINDFIRILKKTL